MLSRHFRLRLKSASKQFSTSSSNWLGDVPMGPPDPILGLTERFNKVRVPLVEPGSCVPPD